MTVAKTAVALATAIFVLGAVFFAASLIGGSAAKTAVALAAAILVMGAVYFGRKPFGSWVQVLGLVGTVLLAVTVGWGFWWLVSGTHI